MTDKLLEMSEGYARMRSKIMQSLGWTEARTDAWFLIPNPLLGNIRPFKFVTMGRTHKLEQFIDACLEDNEPPKRELTLIGSRGKPIVVGNGKTED